MLIDADFYRQRHCEEARRSNLRTTGHCHAKGWSISYLPNGSIFK